MNIYTNFNRSTAQFVAALAMFAMLLSALPVHFFVAEATVFDVESAYGDDIMKKINLCHWDASAKPEPTYKSSGDVSVNALGHEGHDDDIIPAFWYKQTPNSSPVFYDGKNWDAAGYIQWLDCIGTTEGTITVTKVVDGNAIAEDFTLYVDTTEVESGVPTFFTVEDNGGTLYTISEADDVANYVQESLVCMQKDEVLSDLSDADGFQIKLKEGKEISCTITNTYVPPKGSITIEKVAGNDTTTAFDFTGDFSDFMLVGGGDTTFSDLDADTYFVSELETKDWSLLDVTCDDESVWNDVDGVSIDLSAGEDVTCTFTNRPIPQEPPVCDYGFDPDNLLTNGSFEEPVADENSYQGGFFEVFDVIPGWSSDGGFELWNNMFGGASHGMQNAELDVDVSTTITQSVVTIPGATYELRLAFKAREGSGTDNNAFEAEADGVVVLSGATQSTEWSTYRDTFVAVDDSTDITITDTGASDGEGTLVDNAVLCLVEEPAVRVCELEIVSDTTDYVVEKDANAVVLAPTHPAWTAIIPGAQWIWGSNPVEAPTDEDETQTFLKKFGWEGTVTAATLYVASDNSHDADLNGLDAGEATDEQNFRETDKDQYNVMGLINQGNNDLSIAVKNWGEDADPAKNPAGLKYKLHIEGEVTGDEDCSIPYEESYVIDGYKWNDADGDGKWLETESTIGKWGIALRPMAMKAVEELHVSAESAAVVSTANALTAGRTYIVEASGTYSFGNRSDYEADAEWSHRADVYTDNPLAAHGWTVGELTYNSIVGLDLQIDGQNINWGSFNDDHLYKTVVEGDGTALDFSIYDSAYGDNTGGLDVAIYDVTDYVTYTNGDGYYSFEVEAGEYQIVEIMQEGWTQTYPSEPSYYHVTVPDERKGGYNFGNMEDYVEIPGCTDSTATNYNAKANVDDGSCEYPLVCVQGEELLANGDFEDTVVTDPAKWDIFTSGIAWLVDWIAPNGDATDPASLELHAGVNGWVPNTGSQYAELDGDYEGPGGGSGEPASTIISQTIDTIPGEEYILSWAYSPRPGTTQNENDLDVFVNDMNNAVDLESARAGGVNTEWETEVYTFTADSDETTIAFSDDGDANSQGTFLDTVSLMCQPERVIEYGPHCGDGIVGSDVIDGVQDWEQCEPGDTGCTDYCLLDNQCHDERLVKITMGTTDSVSFNDTVYLGSVSNPIPNETWFSFDELGDDIVENIATEDNGLAVSRNTVTGEMTFGFRGENDSKELDQAKGSIETMGIDLGSPNRSPITQWPLEDGTNGFNDVFDVNQTDNTVVFDLRADTGRDAVSVPVAAGDEYGYCPSPDDRYTIQGFVWHDDNENTDWDGWVSEFDFDEGQEEEGGPSEEPLAGWTVSITNGEVTLHAITDVNGYYSFSVPAGTWTITETVKSGWGRTTQESHVVTVPEVFTQAESSSVFAAVINYLIPTAHAQAFSAVVYGDYNFGNNETPARRSGGSPSPRCELFEAEVAGDALTLTWETRNGYDLTIDADGVEVYDEDDRDTVKEGSFKTVVGAREFLLTVNRGSKDDTCLVEIGPDGAVLGESTDASQVTIVPLGAADAGHGGAVPVQTGVQLLAAAFVTRNTRKNA